MLSPLTSSYLNVLLPIKNLFNGRLLQLTLRAEVTRPPVDRYSLIISVVVGGSNV